ncbi:UNVERIFIED_CONTAM: hypothetical protein HDU68_004856 [Siphonaria sp. JEL0065]|nr:hypothetical protein HDU68_004856 [Siphonaria sp. JEL0065]
MSHALFVFKGSNHKVDLSEKAENVPAIVGMDNSKQKLRGFVIVHEESGEQVDVDDNNAERRKLSLRDLGVEAKERYVISPIMDGGLCQM